jgi:cell division protein FtsW (lipid II flippase)
MFTLLSKTPNIIQVLIELIGGTASLVGGIIYIIKKKFPLGSIMIIISLASISTAMFTVSEQYHPLSKFNNFFFICSCVFFCIAFLLGFICVLVKYKNSSYKPSTYYASIYIGIFMLLILIAALVLTILFP